MAGSDPDGDPSGCQIQAALCKYLCVYCSDGSIRPVMQLLSEQDSTFIYRCTVARSVAILVLGQTAPATRSDRDPGLT